MAKEIPTKEFKTALTALNSLLKDSEGENPIKVVGVKKEKVITDFTNKVLDFIEKDNAADLPDVVIDFYNNFIVDDDDEADAKSAKDDKKKPAKEKKKPKEKKPPKEKGPLIITEAIEAYMNGDCTTVQEITDKIGPTFPDRNIHKTVCHIFGVLRHMSPNKK